MLVWCYVLNASMYVCCDGVQYDKRKIYFPYSRYTGSKMFQNFILSIK